MAKVGLILTMDLDTIQYCQLWPTQHTIEPAQYIGKVKTRDNYHGKMQSVNWPRDQVPPSKTGVTPEVQKVSKVSYDRQIRAAVVSAARDVGTDGDVRMPLPNSYNTLFPAMVEELACMVGELGLCSDTSDTSSSSAAAVDPATTDAGATDAATATAATAAALTDGGCSSGGNHGNSKGFPVVIRQNHGKWVTGPQNSRNLHLKACVSPDRAQHYITCAFEPPPGKFLPSRVRAEVGAQVAAMKAHLATFEARAEKEHQKMDHSGLAAVVRGQLQLEDAFFRINWAAAPDADDAAAPLAATDGSGVAAAAGGAAAEEAAADVGSWWGSKSSPVMLYVPPSGPQALGQLSGADVLRQLVSVRRLLSGVGVDGFASVVVPVQDNGNNSSSGRKRMRE